MKKSLVFLAMMLLGTQAFAGNAVCDLIQKHPKVFADVGIGRVLLVSVIMQGAGSGDDAYDQQIALNLKNYTEDAQRKVFQTMTSVPGLDVESLISDSQERHVRAVQGGQLVERILKDVRAQVCSERSAGVCDPNLQRCKSMSQQKSDII